MNAFKDTPNKTAAIYRALASARVEFDEIPRNRVATIRMKAGGQYSYKYADLSDMIRATTPALSAYGLGVMQWPEKGQVMTRLYHESGAEIVTPWPIKALPQRSLDDAQSFQSAMQVAKRYSMGAALGVSTEETIEGDAKAHKTVVSNEPKKDPFIEGDGLRAPHGAKVNSKMSPREMAEEAARAIEAQLQEVKTAAGLNGVWNRNENFISAMQERHDDLFQSVFDKFHSLMESMEAA